MIVVLCGPPGVGKTTVAAQLADRLRDRGVPVDVLDSDQFGTNTYDRMFERVSDSEANWIIAGTFYKREWQVQFERLDDTVVVYLTADLDTCLERNQNRADPIDEKAVHVIWREFDDPDPDITVDVTDCSAEGVVDRLLSELDVSDDDRTA